MRLASETRLRSAFTQILTTVLATSMAGCGGGTTSDVTSTKGGSSGEPGTASTSLCTPDATTSGSLLETMHTTPALDGAEYRSETAFPSTASTNSSVSSDPTATGDGWTATVSGEVGTLCSGAKDVAGCQAKVASYRVLPPTLADCIAQYGTPQAYDRMQCGASYILYTRGDDVRVARTIDETKALISTIDTVGEALWIAQNSNYAANCSTDFPAGSSTSSFRQLTNGNWELADLTTNVCGQDIHVVTVQVDYAGTLTVTSDVATGQNGACAVAGRRPVGLQNAPRGPRGNDLGEHFASMARLEAASVIAFRRLARHLASHGAPPELLARIRIACRDEIRHARSTSALARKYGVVPAAPQIAPESERPSLFALAVENAREGCVRETYGALVAHAQARVATDLDVRRAMSVIADEETAHAALSWDIADWVESQLDARSRALLARERRTNAWNAATTNSGVSTRARKKRRTSARTSRSL